MSNAPIELPPATQIWQGLSPLPQFYAAEHGALGLGVTIQRAISDGRTIKCVWVSEQTLAELRLTFVDFPSEGDPSLAGRIYGFAVKLDSFLAPRMSIVETVDTPTLERAASTIRDLR